MAAGVMDSFVGTKHGPEQQITVLRLSDKRRGKAKFYEVHCRICERDPELCGNAIYLITKNHLSCGRLPCECSKSPKRTKEQLEVLLKRACGDSQIFFGWKDAGSCNTNSTVLIGCKIHKELVYEKCARDVLSGRGCRECRLDKVKSVLTKSDSSHIDEFLATGAFHPNTTFERSDTVTPSARYREGVRRHWNVVCGYCGDIFEKTTIDLKRGHLGCNCPRYRKKFAYIHVIEDNGIPVAIKFGISNGKWKRACDQRKRTRLDVKEFALWEFESSDHCKSAERYLKSSLVTGILSKQEFPDGFTETCSISDLDKIVCTFNEYGGKRLW